MELPLKDLVIPELAGDPGAEGAPAEPAAELIPHHIAGYRAAHERNKKNRPCNGVVPGEKARDKRGDLADENGTGKNGDRARDLVLQRQRVRDLQKVSHGRL